MNTRKNGRANRPRSLRTCGAILALLLVPLALSAGCDEEIQKEFRDAAVGSIESGVNNIADGIINGIFAVAEVNGSSDSSGS